MHRSLATLILLFLLTGCREVPRGAHFEKKGWLLSEEKLELPWVAMSPGQNKWCFARLGFTASSAQVLLEVQAQTPFDPRRIGGIAALEITNASGQAMYHVKGPLEDPCCESQPSKNDKWISEYYDTTMGPATDTSSFYQDIATLTAPIGNFGEYCASLNISESPASLVRPRARVILQSTWK